MWQSQKLLGDDLHPGRSTSSCTRCARGATTRSTSRARTLVRGPVLESEPEGKYDQQRLACSQNKTWRKAERWGDLYMKKSRHATPHLFLTTCSGQEREGFWRVWNKHRPWRRCSIFSWFPGPVPHHLNGYCCWLLKTLIEERLAFISQHTVAHIPFFNIRKMPSHVLL